MQIAFFPLSLVEWIADLDTSLGFFIAIYDEETKQNYVDYEYAECKAKGRWTENEKVVLESISASG